MADSNDNKKLPFWDLIRPGTTEQTEQVFKTFKAKADARRTLTERSADWITSKFGSITFLLINVIGFAAWVLINTDSIASIPAFDPYPFNLLTTVVSLEAIFLSIFVLIYQNRASKVDDLREEIDLQVNLITERELTKVLKMLAAISEKHGIDVANDLELKKMLKTVSADKLEKSLGKEI